MVLCAVIVVIVKMIPSLPWWRHQRETFSVLLALCAGNSPNKGQWCRALMFSLICAWTNSWSNNWDASDLRSHHTHYDVTVKFMGNVTTFDGLVQYCSFIHDRPWISLWIKSISNKLDIIIHLIVSQLSHYCDVYSNWLWHHQQNEDRASETQGRCVKIVIFNHHLWIRYVMHEIKYCCFSIGTQ